MNNNLKQDLIAISDLEKQRDDWQVLAVERGNRVDEAERQTAIADQLAV